MLRKVMTKVLREEEKQHLITKRLFIVIYIYNEKQTIKQAVTRYQI